MSIKLLKLTSGEVTYYASGDSELLNPIKNDVLAQLSKNIGAAGFRKGKLPADLAEKHVDQRLLQSEVLDRALNDLFFKVIDDNNLKPVGKPRVEIKKFVPFDNIECQITVAVVPDFKLADYKKLKIDKPKATVTNEDVSQVLETLRQRSAKKEAVNRSAKIGDEVVIDFKGTNLKGEPINGADGKNYPLTLGSNSFIPGFEDNLIGQQTGQAKSFKIKFPKDYAVKALANKDVKFDVTVNIVNQLSLPTLDDDFAKTVGPFKNIGELTEDIKKQLVAEREASANHQLEEDIIKTITERTKFEPPKILVEDQLKRDFDSFKQNLVYRGQTLNEYLSAESTTEADLTNNVLEPQAIQKVKGALVISAIAEQEAITVENSELDKYITQLKDRYKSDPKMQEELSKSENRREIAGRLLSRKTLDMLINYLS